MRVGCTKTAISSHLATSSKTSEIRQTILHDDMLPLVGLQNDCKMNDLDWLFHVKIRFRPAFFESERLNVTK